MAKPLTYDATLIERRDLTSSLAIFKVRPDEPYTGEEPWFVPGQYVTLGLNNLDQPELGSVRRPMSIVSAPQEQGVMEFYIRYVSHPESDNPLTHLLWKSQAGDRIFMRPKAVGRFTLPHTIGNDDPRLKICVAAGTGLAPFVSMVRSERLLDPAADLSDFAILHGASYPDDLGYQDELGQLVANNGLRYMTTVSRPQEAPDWPGDCGRVEDYFLAERLPQLEERLGLTHGQLTAKTATVFICGLQGTIGKTIVRLLGRGFVPENRKLRRALEVPDEVAPTLFFEQYDNTPVIDIKDPAVVEPLRAELHQALAAL